MPTSSASSASRRLLALLSLLQIRRDWPGEVLAERLAVSPRTVRRDVDRLRELGYPVRAAKGPDGGYRLGAGAHLPPLLFDDEQAVAVAIALRGAALVGAGIEEPAARALATLRQVLPARLRARVDALEQTIIAPPPQLDDAPVVPAVLYAISDAIRTRTELRFDYLSPSPATPGGTATTSVRQAQPHHLLARHGRWYLLAWDPAPAGWRTFRVDRLTPRVPSGPRFIPRAVPGGDPVRYLAARFKGSDGPDQWPCQGEVIVKLPAHEVLRFSRDGVVEALDDDRCRLRLGAWSWAGLAALLVRFDADIEASAPAELRAAFSELALRATKAAQ